MKIKVEKKKCNSCLLQKLAKILILNTFNSYVKLSDHHHTILMTYYVSQYLDV